MNRITSRPAVQILLLLLVCIAVYWVRLGEGGFHSTEAHRVIPAYEMLENGDWLLPRMFEQPYLRKPPGMPWAVALSSAVLGQTEFAARAVSAACSTAMVLVAFAFARRWFGPRAALAAGLAQALMPVLWESGRAAEIEALNHLGCQIAALMLIDALLFAENRRARVRAALGAGFGIFWLATAKGPAAAPVLLAVIAAACVVGRSLDPLRGIAWLAIGSGLFFVALLGALITRAAALEPTPPVVQSPGAFLFEPGMLVGVATLVPVTFFQMLPVSFALLFPWGRDARGESASGLGDRSFAVAHALAWAWIIAAGIFMLMGVRNPRYTLPAAVLLPPLVGYAVAGMGVWMTPRRERIARSMLLGRAWVWPVLLVVAAWVYVGTIEADRRATSGRAEGERLGETIASMASVYRIWGENVVLLADQMIEARPEVLLAAERSARAAGLDGFRVRWIPGLGVDTPVQGTNEVVFMALRDDEGDDEAARVEARFGRKIRLLDEPGEAAWSVHKFRFRLYLMSDR